MKNTMSKNYNRFIQYGNSPVCVYGNKIITAAARRERKSIVGLIYLMLNKSYSRKTRSG
jgi:hypothetical protein